MNSPEFSPPPSLRRPESRPNLPPAAPEQPGGSAEAAPANANRSPVSAPSTAPSTPPLPVDQPTERFEAPVSRPVVALPRRADESHITKAYVRQVEEVVRGTAGDPAAQKDAIIRITEDFHEKVDSPAGV